MIIDPLYLYSLQISFAILFVMSGMEKSRDTTTFTALMQDYRLVPSALVTPVAAAIVTAELLTAIFLVTPAFKYGVMLGAALLLLYATAISINLLRGRTHIDCGCLGSTHNSGISFPHVLRNGLLAAILLSCLFPLEDRSLTALDMVVIPLFILGAGLSYVTLSLLLDYRVNTRMWWG